MTLVDFWMTLTSAPAIAAPVESVTWPRMIARCACANNKPAPARRKTAKLTEFPDRLMRTSIIGWIEGLCAQVCVCQVVANGFANRRSTPGFQRVEDRI